MAIKKKGLLASFIEGFKSEIGKPSPKAEELGEQANQYIRQSIANKKSSENETDLLTAIQNNKNNNDNIFNFMRTQTTDEIVKNKQADSNGDYQLGSVFQNVAEQRKNDAQEVTNGNLRASLNNQVANSSTNKKSEEELIKEEEQQKIERKANAHNIAYNSLSDQEKKDYESYMQKISGNETTVGPRKTIPVSEAEKKAFQKYQTAFQKNDNDIVLMSKEQYQKYQEEHPELVKKQAEEAQKKAEEYKKNTPLVEKVGNALGDWQVTLTDNAGKAVSGAVKGLINLSAWGTKKNPMISSNPEIQEWIDEEKEKLTAPFESFNNRMDSQDSFASYDAERQGKTLGWINDKIMPTVGQMVPAIVMGAAGSMGAAGAAGGNIASGVTQFLVSEGSYQDDAKARGMDEDETMIYSTIMAGFEGLSEGITFGNAQKVGALTKEKVLLKSGKTAKDIVGETAKKQAIKEANTSILKRLGLNALENAFQEGITEPVQELTAKGVSLGLTGEDKSNWENMLQRSGESAFVGGIIAVLLGGSSAGVSSATDVTSKMVSNAQSGKAINAGISDSQIINAYKDSAKVVDANKIMSDTITRQNEKYNAALNEINNNLNQEKNVNGVQNTNLKESLRNQDAETTSVIDKAKSIDEMYGTELTKDVEEAVNRGKLNRENYAELDHKLTQLSQLENAQDLYNHAERLDEILELKNTDKSLSSAVAELANNSKITPENYNELKNRFNEIDNQMPYVAEESDNKKIDIFRDDMTNFMNNSVQSHNFAKSVESIIEKTGLNIRLNNQLGNDINGVIHNKNGETIIEINPNSNQAGEFVLMHELSHAIGNQDLKQTILDYANKNKEFETALKDLEARYGQNDVTDEVMADISGQLLGNEEFINSIAKEQPSKFKQIYNAVKSWVKKFTGTYGYEDFVRDVETKWRKAYEQNKNSITENIEQKILNNKTTLEEIPLFSKNAKENSIQGLESYSRQEIKDISKRYIQNLLEDKGIDANIEDIEIHGSRNRGTATAESDLDIVVQYNGDIREDDLFNILNENPLEIDGIKVDINPIQENMENYMARSNEYDNQILENTDKVEKIQNKSYNIINKSITKSERSQVESEVLTWRSKQKDGIGYIDLSDKGYKSYIYNKQDNEVETLLKVNGSEDFKNFIRKGIENGTFTEAEGFNKSVAEIKNEYRRYRISNDSMSRGKSNNRNDQFSNRQIRREESSNPRGNLKQNSGNESIINKESENNSDSFNLQKNKQLDIIKNNNPMQDEYHTGIRKLEDIKTLQEAIEDSDYKDNDSYTPDLTKKDIENAIQTGKITVYSSYPIEQGVFVSPSKMEAQNYAGNNQIFSKEVNINDVAWIDPLEGQYAQTDIQVKLPKEDNQGRTLTKEQQEYFKDSKIRDDTGKLKTIYHTTTDKVAQFNEFNPVGTKYYRFGNQAVNYFTDSKDMSGSYANSKYKQADTKKLTSINDVKEYLDTLNKGNVNQYFLRESNGKSYIVESSDIDSKALDFLNSLSKDELQQLKDNIYHDEDFSGTPYEYLFEWDKFEPELQNKYKNLTNEYVGNDKLIDIQKRMMEYLNDSTKYNKNKIYNGTLIKSYTNQNELFRNLKQDIQKADWTNNNKIQYSGYLNITNPYIIDANGKAWNKVNSKLEKNIKKQISEIKSDKAKVFGLMDLAIESQEKHQAYIDSEEAKQYPLSSTLARDIGRGKSTPYRQALEDVYMFGFNYDDYINTLKKKDNNIPDGNTKVKDVLTEYGEIHDSNDIQRRFEKLDAFGEMTLNDFFKKANELYNLNHEYGKESSYFEAHSNDILKIDPMKYFQENFITPEQLFKIAKRDFTDNAILDVLGENESTNDIVNKVLEMNKNGENYDGIIMKNVIDYGGTPGEIIKPADVYVTFNSNQFKAIDNSSPTLDSDIRYSKQSVKWQEWLEKNFPARGTTNKLSKMKQILPVKDTIQNNNKSTSNNIKNIPDNVKSKIEDGLRTIYPVELTNEELKTIVNNIASNPTEEGILDALNDYRTTYIEDDTVDNRTINEIKSTIRNTKLNVSKLKNSISDYNDTRKANFGKLRLGNDGMNVDSFYQELSNNYPEYFDSDITNEADQLDSIINFMNEDYTGETAYEMSDEDIRSSGLVDAIKEAITNNTTTLPLGNSKKLLDAKRQNIAPTTQQEASMPLRASEQIANDKNLSDLEAIQEESQQVITSSKKIAEQVEKELASQEIEKSPTIDFIKEKRSKEKTTFTEIKDALAQKFVNKGHYIDKLAKESKNPRLTWLYDRTMNSFNEAQISIGDKQITSDGEVVGKSIIDIFKPVGDKQLTKEFNDYLLNKHNIARYGYEKGVFGTEVSAEQSKQIVKYYEKKYPEFKEWGKEASQYNDNNLKDLVNNGLVSEELYKKLRNMYPDYVPTFRDITEDMSNFTIDDRVGSNTLKKATGSNLDILSVQESMAEQTLAIKKAIRMNNLGLELYNTLHPSKSDIILSGIEFDPSAMMTLNGDVVDKNTDGTNMYTIFKDGEMITFKISDDLYTAFQKDTLQNRINNSKAAKALLTPLEKLSKVQRSLLTTYSVGFAFNNPIKDYGNALVNTKFSDLKFIKNYPKALYNIATNGDWYQSYKNNGGTANTYFDYEKGLLPTKTKNPIKKFANKVAAINEVLEQAPRLTEYISTIENGGTVDEALYNAADVTVNFKRGGDITKAVNKYGANFLNASVQGLDKAYRNITGQNGVKGYSRLLVNATLSAVAPALLNNLLLGDDDDYEELPDYIKDNYFLFKIGDNKFFRIPKGNVSSVIGSIARRANDAARGKEVDWGTLVDTSINQLAPNNPATDNVIAPILQAKNNKAWYGGDIVGTRLQKLPAAEQYDEKTDSVSKFLGKALNISPKKINYVLDQYSGGIGDLILPTLTPQAENNILEDKFTTNSTMKSKYPSNFFSKADELQIASNSESATSEDKLKYMFMNELKTGKNLTIDGDTMSSGISDLYAQKRAIQNSNVSDSEKKVELEKVQEQINKIAKYGLDNSSNIKIDGNVATIPNSNFKWINENGTWKKLDDKTKTKLQSNNIALDAYADYKNKVAKYKTTLGDEESIKQNDKIKILSNMKISDKNKKGIYSAFIGTTDSAYDNIKNNVNINDYLDYKTEVAGLTKESEKIRKLKNADYDSKTKQIIFENTTGKDDSTYSAIKNAVDIDSYLDYKTQTFSADKDSNGNSISGTRKQKIVDYLNSVNMDYEAKLIILGLNNKLTSSELSEVYNYVDSKNLSASQKLAIYSKVKGFTVNGNNVKW